MDKLQGAGGAIGEIARGEAPQRGAQPREKEGKTKQAPKVRQNVVNKKLIDPPPLRGFVFLSSWILG